jgi:hypothetical protein
MTTDVSSSSPVRFVDGTGGIMILADSTIAGLIVPRLFAVRLG